MMLPFLAFIALAGTIFFGYLGVTYLPGILAGRRLEQRLRDVSSVDDPAAEGDNTVVKQRESGPLPLIDKFVSRTRAGSWLGRLIEKAGVKTTPSAVVMISLTSAASGALVARMLGPSHSSLWPTPVRRATQPSRMISVR